MLNFEVILGGIHFVHRLEFFLGLYLRNYLPDYSETEKFRKFSQLLKNSFAVVLFFQKIFFALKKTQKMFILK